MNNIYILNLCYHAIGRNGVFTITKGGNDEIQSASLYITKIIIYMHGKFLAEVYHILFIFYCLIINHNYPNKQDM